MDIEKYVTFTFNPTTMVNKPSLTISAALAYSYDTREAADIAIEMLKAVEFPHDVEPDKYLHKKDLCKWRLREKKAAAVIPDPDCPVCQELLACGAHPEASFHLAPLTPEQADAFVKAVNDDLAETEHMDDIAAAIKEKRPELRAHIEQTGGGILCIFIEEKEPVWYYFGTANDYWGADVMRGDHQFDSVITLVRSDEKDPNVVADGIIRALDKFKADYQCEHCQSTQFLTLLKCSGGATGDIYACTDAFDEHKAKCFACHPDATKASEELADCIIRDIRKLGGVGSTFRAFRSFQELHEYIDANTLAESDLDRIQTRLVGTVPQEGDDDMVQMNCDLLHAAQDIADKWLKTQHAGVGRPEPEAAKWTQSFAQDLDRFVDTAATLCETWDAGWREELGNKLSGDDYPFGEDFSELLLKMMRWRDTVRENIANGVTVKPYGD